MESTSISASLLLLKSQLYDPCFVDLAELRMVSKSYDACSFQLNGKRVIYRASKLTPKKTGQFVAIWKRNEQGITAPFDASDDFDFMVIAALSAERVGQFVFPKAVLIKQGVISLNHAGGKRGMRVYPFWDIVTSKQARKTQLWQGEWFLEVTHDPTEGSIQLKRLLKKEQYLDS